MNKSIYKKQLAFKNSLPQYGNGGKKFAAGLAGFASGLPGIGPVIGAATANTPAVKDNPVATKAGKFGATVLVEGTKMALNPMSAISGAPKIIGEGLDLGSTVAEEKGNTQRADRLDTAAMGMQGVGQIAGMATGMVGQFGGQGQFNPMQMFGGNTPVVMKNGGRINTLEGDLYSKVIMERNKNKDFVQRAFNPDPNKIQYNPDGTTSTHQMSWGTDNTGQAFMFPTIFNDKNEAVKVPNQYADYISSEGYKKATGMIKKNGGSIPKYPDGGSIHIDPAKRGTFKAQATRMGMGVQEAASKILNAPEGTYSPEMRKKANFAKNFAKEDGGYMEEFKDGGMIKRADGSYSKRGLWDNIRANKGSGKEPTKEMLEQERKIKANKKEDGGWLHGYESTITRLPNNMAAWSYKNGGKLKNKEDDWMSEEGKINAETIQDFKPSDLERKSYFEPIVKNYDLGDTDNQIWLDNEKHHNLTNRALIYEKELTNPNRTWADVLTNRFIYPYAAEHLPSKSNSIFRKGQSPIYAIKDKIGKEFTDKHFDDVRNATLRVAWRQSNLNELYPDLNLQSVFQYENGGSLINFKGPKHENGAIHKGNPTAELELKENGLNGNGEPFQVNAPSHEEGGVKVNLKEGAKILSDNKGLFGKNTPAKEAAPLIKELKQLQNRKDNISENTKKRYEEKINEIFQKQEQFKEMKQAKSNPLMMAKNGGKLPKYNDGAYFNPYGLGSGTVNTFGTTPTESMNTMTPSVMLDNTTIPSIKDRSNKNFTNTNTETINSSLFPTKNRFAPATMNNPNLAGNKTNPNLLPINNPIIPTQSGMSQRRAVDFGANFDRNSPFKADKADTGSIFSQPGVAGGALKNVPSTLYNLGVGLFGKVQKTPPVLTQRTKEIGPVRFDTNKIDLERNTALAGNNPSSFAIKNANAQNIYRGSQTLKGDLAQKEALANVGIQEQNQARALQENLTDQKAIQLAQQLNISAEQAKKLALQEGIAGIGEIMDDTSKQKIAYGENQLGFGALQTMFSNWKLKNPGGTYSSFLKSIGKGGGAIEFVS